MRGEAILIVMDIEIYKEAVDFLLTFDSITKKDINEHLTPRDNKPKDLKVIYNRLCFHAKNANMKVNVIGDIERLRPVLFDFDPFRVANEYDIRDDDKLLNEIENSIRQKIRREKQSIWPKYCKTLIESAYFLKSFDTAEKFYEWTDFFTNNYLAKPALPFLINSEIYGYGFALACDFLKELGFVEYGKPDVHLKDIFTELKLIDNDSKSIEIKILRALDKIANANQVTSYNVDKIFWLIGSGDFYRTNKKIGSQKDNFIQKIKEKYLI